MVMAPAARAAAASAGVASAPPAPQPGLGELPDALVRHVAALVDVRTAVALMGTCRHVRRAMTARAAAKQAYTQAFGCPPRLRPFADDGEEGEDDDEAGRRAWACVRSRDAVERAWRDGARYARHVELVGHADWVHAAHVRWRTHPDDVTFTNVVVLSASDDQTLRTWDVGTGECVSCTPSPTPDDLVPHHVKLSDSIAAAAAAADYSRRERASSVVEWGATDACPVTLRVGGPRGTELHVHDALGERVAALAGPGGHTARIECCELDPASRRVATGGRDGTACVWSLDLGASSGGAQPPVASFAHTATVRCLCFARGTSLVTGCSDGSLWHWDVATGERVGHLPPGDSVAACEGALSEHCVTAFACDARHTRCAAGRRNGTVTVWSLEGRHRVLRTLSDHAAAVLVLSLDPFSLLSAGKDRVVHAYLFGCAANGRHAPAHLPDAAPDVPDGPRSAAAAAAAPRA